MQVESFIPLLDFRSLWMMFLLWMYCIPGNW